MKLTRIILRGAILWLLATPHFMFAQNAEFRSLFDGQSLNGWETPVPSYWSVEEGAITARITKEHPCATNQYLVWKGGELADFELKLKSRVRGEGAINNGFQFRSRLLPDHDICGYQVDNNLQTDWLVRLYDEFGRHTLAMRGEHAHFDTNGLRTATKIENASGTAWFKLEEWHEYHLICRGPDITLDVDGKRACEVHDDDPRRRELQGILGLQLHSGPPTVAQFKDIRLRILKPASPAPRSPQPNTKQAALQKEAIAWWPLDAGAQGATPWLRHVPGWEKFEMNVRAVGPRATANGNVILMHGAYFESAPDVLPPSNSFTIYLRARNANGKWKGGLVSKEGSFALSADSAIHFSISTDQGPRDVSFPLSDVDPLAWHELVARYDQTTVSLFCDGRKMDSQTCAGKVAQSNSPFLIAAQSERGAISGQFEGELETAALWSRALTDSEIAALSEISSR
jgi:hypothetical protein